MSKFIIVSDASNCSFRDLLNTGKSLLTSSICPTHWLISSSSMQLMKIQNHRLLRKSDIFITDKLPNPDHSTVVFLRAGDTLAQDALSLIAQHTEAEKTFKEVNMAYEVLSNQEKRTMYDQKQRPRQENFIRPEDMFTELFGGAININFQQQRVAANFPRYKAAVNLSLAETLQPQERVILVQTKKPCDGCKGTAVEKKPVRCDVCGGSGRCRGW